MNLELLQPHTHSGMLLSPGFHLDVDEPTARWLIERGIAQPAAKPITEHADVGSKTQLTTRKGD